MDNTSLLEQAVEFFNLGIGEYIPFSSISGSGTGELLDELLKHFDDDVEPDDDETSKICSDWKTKCWQIIFY